MMKAIGGVVLALVIIIIGLTIYLSPDNLSSCGEKPSDAPSCHAADAIVAVSGGDTAARTAEAIRLYQNGWAPNGPTSALDSGNNGSGTSPGTCPQPSSSPWGVSAV